MIGWAILFATVTSTQTATLPVAQPVEANATAASSDEGFVTAELAVNESGTVDKCTVISSNAPSEFSEKVCGILAAKAKFEPKRDATGVAQKNTVTQTIRFKLQN